MSGHLSPTVHRRFRTDCRFCGPACRPATRRARGPRDRALGVVPWFLAAAALWDFTPAIAARSTSLDLRAADSLAAQAPSARRDRELERWAKGARLRDLLYVLRRSAVELEGAETPLVRAALARTAEERWVLRRHLVARLRAADPRARLGREDLADDLPPHPRASVFRVAALLPDSGDYRGYGAAVLEGIRAGLADAESPLPIELEVLSTGVDRADRVIAAFDAVADRSGVLIGELLSIPSLVLATAAHFGQLPLVSPTATDESIGAIGPGIFQIGPSNFERGVRIAHVALRDGPARVGILVSSAVERSAFARGFTAAAEARGATVTWRGRYAPGDNDFRDAVNAMVTSRVEVLLWDGEAHEAGALLRQLARERAAIRVCGGEELAPERHYVETRALLEGVQYVGEEWQLADSLQARLDSRVLAATGETTSSLHIHGYLAARMVDAAVTWGALCPGEIREYLASQVTREPYLRAHGYLAVQVAGAELPVYAVRRGRAEPVQ